MIGRMARRTATITDGRLAARLAALASLGAAIIHFAVVPTHWQAWVPSGLFFVSIALLQLLWASVALTRPTASVLGAGITLNIGIIALWALSRTAGAPFGPGAGEPEMVHGADLCALLLEVYVVMGAGWAAYRGRRAGSIPGLVNAAVLLGIGAVITSAATVGVASGVRHDHHGPADAAADHHTSPGEHQNHHRDTQAPTEAAPPPHHVPMPVEASPPAPESAHDGSDHHHDE